MKRRINSVFWQSLSLNSVIVLVITIALTALGFEMDQSSRQAEQRKSQNILSDRLEQLSDQLSDTKKYLAVVQAASALTADQKYDAVLDYIEAIRQPDALVRKVMVTYPENDIIISDGEIFSGISSRLPYYNVGNVPDEFFGTAVSILTENYLMGEDPGGGFVYTLALPEKNGMPAMNAAIYIDRDALMNMLFTEDMGRYSKAELFFTESDRSDTCQIAALQGEWFAAEDVYQCNISSGGLTMNVLIEKNYFDSQLFLVGHYLVFMVIVTVIAGIVTAYFASTSQNKPVKKAIHALSERGLITSEDRNLFSGLLNSVDSLMTEKADAQQQLSAYQTQLRNNMLDRLFASTVPCPGLEESVAMEYENFPSKSMVYYCKVLISAADDSQSMEMTVMMLLEFLRKQLPENAVIHSTDALTFGLVYPYCGSDEKTDRELETALDEVPKYFSAQVVAVSGGYCDSIAAVGMCYERAQLGYYASSERRAPRQIILEPDDPLAFDEALQLRPLHTMYQYMASGDSEHAVAALETFFVCPTDVQLIDIRERYCALKVQILLACREIAPNCAMPSIPNFRITDSAEEQLAQLTQAVRQVSAYAQQRQNSARDDQFSTLMEYLNTHYSDSSLCAASLADEFRVSEKYLFSLFKKRTGYSPISYLHRIRMQQAAKLLVESDLTAQEISEKVGFANFGTFHKAFKREFGLAPSKYRETAVRE